MVKEGWRKTHCHHPAYDKDKIYLPSVTTKTWGNFMWFKVTLMKRGKELNSIEVYFSLIKIPVLVFLAGGWISPEQWLWDHVILPSFMALLSLTRGLRAFIILTSREPKWKDPAEACGRCFSNWGTPRDRSQKFCLHAEDKNSVIGYP